MTESAAPITVGIVEPSHVYREGLCRVLGADGRFKLLPEPSATINRLLDGPQPELIVIDPSSGGRLDFAVLEELGRAAPSSHIAILTRVTDIADAARAIRLGASYLLKRRDDEPRSLCNAFAHHAREGAWSVVVDADIARQLSAPPASPEPVQPSKDLTPYEVEIVRLVAGNVSDKEIARHYGIDPSIVRTHVAVMRHKYGATSRAELIAMARASGLIQKE